MKLAKIIFGAKNTDIQSLEPIIKSYALASADIFDVCADSHVINKTREIISDLNLQISPKICASITLDNDIHGYKAQLNYNNCTNCKLCIEVCPQKSITEKNNNININKESCTGCSQCTKTCPNKAIKLVYDSQSFYTQYENSKSADIIEIHTNGQDKNLYEIFEYLKTNYTGEIGICISNNNDINQKINIINKTKTIIFPKKLIVQADGNSISGLTNDIATTQKAVEECKIFQDIADIILIASGGTNEKTNTLLNAEKINVSGIAWGSYARKLIQETLTNEKKLQAAKRLIDTLKG